MYCTVQQQYRLSCCGMQPKDPMPASTNLQATTPMTNWVEAPPSRPSCTQPQAPLGVLAASPFLILTLLSCHQRALLSIVSAWRGRSAMAMGPVCQMIPSRWLMGLTRLTPRSRDILCVLQPQAATLARSDSLSFCADTLQPATACATLHLTSCWPIHNYITQLLRHCLPNPACV